MRTSRHKYTHSGQEHNEGHQYMEWKSVETNVAKEKVVREYGNLFLMFRLQV